MNPTPTMCCYCCVTSDNCLMKSEQMGFPSLSFQVGITILSGVPLYFFQKEVNDF